MTSRRICLAAVRAVACGTLGLLALLAACERQLPTSAEVAAMDATAVEELLEKLKLAEPTSGTLIYYLDGAPVSADVARAIPAGVITGTAVLREPRAVCIHLKTRQGEESHPATVGEDSVRDLRLELKRGGSAPVTSGGNTREGAAPAAGRFEGLIILDGEPVPPSALRGIQPEQVERVEIIKGEPASRMYDDPRAAQGVIRITTRQVTARR